MENSSLPAYSVPHPFLATDSPLLAYSVPRPYYRLQTVHYRLTVSPAHSSKVIGDSVEVVDWLGVILVLTELREVQTTAG